jgi:hypothetical protein
MRTTIWSSLAGFWCMLMHPAPMWPVHGYYRCPACWRQYAVPWEGGVVVAEGSGQLLRSNIRPIRDERVAGPVHF